MNITARKILRPIKITAMTIVIVSILFLVVFPFYFMMIAGTYSTSGLFTGIKWLPGPSFWDNWEIVSRFSVYRYYLNSVLVAATVSIGGVLVSAMAGTALAKYNFRGKKAVYAFILAILMIPGQVGIVGFVIQMVMMGMRNTLWALIIPGFANAFGVFWMTKFITGSVPDELLACARIDGCGEFGLFTRIVLPLARPAIVSLSLLMFLWSWNNYLVPLLIITSNDRMTIPLMLKMFLDTQYFEIGAVMLSTAIATLPVLVVFAVFNKSLINGLLSGAIKG